jgi:hypothetical protein
LRRDCAGADTTRGVVVCTRAVVFTQARGFPHKLLPGVQHVPLLKVIGLIGVWVVDIIHPPLASFNSNRAPHVHQ